MVKLWLSEEGSNSKDKTRKMTWAQRDGMFSIFWADPKSRRWKDARTRPLDWCSSSRPKACAGAQRPCSGHRRPTAPERCMEFSYQFTHVEPLLGWWSIGTPRTIPFSEFSSRFSKIGECCCTRVFPVHKPGRRYSAMSAFLL